ncbi:unnamed protein product [Rhizoctonia solani]|uniref:Uncharacterized protein n=1 Tax=Rhizoctonia solani TaxID=456999 RepID=A0A8H2WF63_9AGAM|nr:unnamed protein product [Rhizoctonia solani]
MGRQSPSVATSRAASVTLAGNSANNAIYSMHCSSYNPSLKTKGKSTPVAQADPTKLYCLLATGQISQ